MKHLIPKECVPAKCVDGSCPVALVKEYGYDVVGIPYDFTCKDCSENITYCEECKYFTECRIIKENKE